MAALPVAIAACSASASPTASRSTLVVIDPKVSSHEMIDSVMSAHVAVLRVDGDRDGVEQVTDILQWHPQIKALHLVTHGTPGAVYLGSTLLNLEAIAQYEILLQSWEIESLVIYDSEVAAGDAGMAFLQKLHQMTGAAIVTSTLPIPVNI